MTQKFKKGDKVQHPAEPSGKFPAGTGTVEVVRVGKAGAPTTYRVRSDKSGELLPVEFFEKELKGAG